MKRLFLIDAYALVFKYYYAFMGRPMRNRHGMNTSILFGFTKFLRDILKREQPDLLGVAFDPKGGSFRKQIYPEYKANRLDTPEDIILSVPYLQRLLAAMRIPVFEIEGFEADDVIGTLAYRGAEAGYEVFMVTPDKDYCQLVGPHRNIYRQKGDGIEISTRRPYAPATESRTRYSCATFWPSGATPRTTSPACPASARRAPASLSHSGARQKTYSRMPPRSRESRARRSPHGATACFWQSV